MLRGYSFHLRGWALAAAALACVAFVSLGQWQSRRADEKRALGLALEQAARAPAVELTPDSEPAALIHKRVSVHGPFLAERTVLLDNKLRHGKPGYEVVTPLRIGNSNAYVLINRGWIAAPPRREVLPPVRTAEGEQRIEGVALERLPQALRAGTEPKGRVRQNLIVADFAAETGLRLHPVVVEQHSAADDGLAREWPRPDLGVEKHESYSLQWYSLAALAVALALVLSFRRVAEA
jgi:surfeit locus 1 family protein